MATPVAHSILAAIVFRLGARHFARRPLLWLFGCVVMASAPDLDFLPGILAGAPALYHQGPTHSVLVGAVVAALVALPLVRDESRLAAVLLLAAAYASHPLLDVFARDGRPPVGVPLLWPLSDTHWNLFPIFVGVSHSPSTGASTSVWFEKVFSAHNLLAIGSELAVMLPLLALVLFLTRRRAR